MLRWILVSVLVSAVIWVVAITTLVGLIYFGPPKRFVGSPDLRCLVSRRLTHNHWWFGHPNSNVPTIFLAARHN